MPHPQGVLPVGNQYLVPPEEAARSSDARLRGLGPHLSRLSDELLLRVLGGDSDAADGGGGVGGAGLAALAGCSRVLRAFAYHEDLWKATTLNTFGGDFTFAGNSWRETYGAAVVRAADKEKSGRSSGGGEDGDDDDGDGDGDAAGAKQTRESRMRDDGDGAGAPGQRPTPSPPAAAIYSDTLYYRYMGANLPLAPEWLSVDTIPRRHHASLSERDFIEEFETTNTPVVLSGACLHWPAVKHGQGEERGGERDDRPDTTHSVMI